MSARLDVAARLIAPALLAALGVPAAAQSGVPATESVLLASVPHENDALGASCALDGDTLVVGAPSDQEQAYDAGAAYVFVRQNGTWTQQAKLTASDGAYLDRFGTSVDISGDLIVVGVQFHNVTRPVGQEGAAYVFARNGGVWTQEAQLLAPQPELNAYFGRSVAIEGERIVVGAPRDSIGVIHDCGTATVFVRSGGIWTPESELRAPDAHFDHEFGASVALDAGTIAVSAGQDDTQGIDAGAVYVFAHGGSNWVLQGKLIPASAGPYDAVGTSAPGGLSIDGDTLAIGSWGADVADLYACGAVWVFTRTGATWTEQAELAVSDPAQSQHFGATVSLDGDLLASGSWGHDLPGKVEAGAGYLFARSGGTWTQVAQFVDTGDSEFDSLGFSTALQDGTLVLGCVRHGPGDALHGSGAAHVYALDLTWLDLQGGLAGAAGVPSLSGTGTLAPGSAGTLTLSGAHASALSILFASFASAPAPFKGGVLITVPVVFQLPLFTSAGGGWALAWSSWPAGIPSGFKLYFQAAIADAGAPFGAALSNGLRAEIP
jgi:hypothetical protein